MSKYENYDSTCHVYDNQRVAVGADVMLAMVQLYSGKPLQEMHILDAGCGTGNYAKALLEFGVGQITLLDVSPGMLDVARHKLSDFVAQGRVKTIIEAKMPPIPFPDNSFDAVMLNVVLNHLDKDDPNFPNSVETIKESRRVLKLNGVIVISAMLSSAAERVTWFTQLNTELTKRFIKSVIPSLSDYERMFATAGVKCIQKMNILGSDIYKGYHQYEGPFDESWRRTSSYWSFATEKETKEALEKLKELRGNGDFEGWSKAHDLFSTTGILTIFICTFL